MKFAGGVCLEGGFVRKLARESMGFKKNTWLKGISVGQNRPTLCQPGIFRGAL
jgi:hypothetical protein